MIWTEVTPGRVDRTDIVVLVQGDGHAEVGEEGHLPHLQGGEGRARAVGLGLRAMARAGPHISPSYQKVWNSA